MNFKQNFLKASKVSVLTLYCIVLAIELICYSLRQPVNNFSAWQFFGSMALTIMLLEVYLSVASFCPKILRMIVSGVLGLSVSLVVITGAFVYSEFGEFVTMSKLQFFVNNITYGLTLAKAFISGWYILLLLGIIVMFSFVIYRISTNRYEKRKSYKRELITLPIILLVFFVLLNQVAHHSKGTIIDMHTSLAASAKMIKGKYAKGLSRSTFREAPDKIISNSNYNFLIIINESFGMKAFAPDDSSAMPLLKQRLANMQSRAFFFENAFTNSSATEISLSSMLTGVAPYQDKMVLYRLPFIWQWFKSADYKTGYISAQHFSWMGFDKFFDNLPDIAISADDIDRPNVNDAIDDSYMLGLVCKNINKIKQQKFLMMFNTNALHSPYLQETELFKPRIKYKSKLKNSALIVDMVIDSLLNYVDKLNLLENTIVVITGDHGDNDNMIHSHGRIDSYYEEVQNIPLMMILPQDLADRNRDILNKNKRQVAANLDILPTLLNILADNYSERNQKLINEMQGISLLKQIPDSRYSISLNTNDIRQWDSEGFGIFFKNNRFVYFDNDGPQFYDISRDKNQLNNLWSKTSSKNKAKIEKIINSTFQLRRMYKTK